MKTKDLTGQMFGRWKVLYQVEDYISPKGQHQPVWMCECQCDKHTKKPVIAYVLNRGESTSCGCYSIEAVKDRNSKQNIYKLINDKYYIGYTQSGKEFYFDKEDYNLVKQYCWVIDNSTGYVKTIDRINNTGKLYLHRLVMGCTKGDGVTVDHISGKRVDCRKNNLRFVTRCQNNMNSHIRSDNTSGVKGVSWCSRDNVWEAWIRINHERIYLGKYNKFEDAVKMRKQAEEEYFGEYSYDNSQKLHKEINT